MKRRQQVAVALIGAGLAAQAYLAYEYPCRPRKSLGWPEVAGAAAGDALILWLMLSTPKRESARQWGQARCMPGGQS